MTKLPEIFDRKVNLSDETKIAIIEGSKDLICQFHIELASAYAKWLEKKEGLPWTLPHQFVFRCGIWREEPFFYDFTISDVNEIEEHLISAFLMAREKWTYEILILEFNINKENCFSLGYRPAFYKNRIPGRNIAEEEVVKNITEGNTIYPPEKEKTDQCGGVAESNKRPSFINGLRQSQTNLLKAVFGEKK